LSVPEVDKVARPDYSARWPGSADRDHPAHHVDRPGCADDVL